MSDLDTPKIKDVIPINFSAYSADAALMRSRLEYLVNRRDQMFDRLRFGYLALNGASLTALMACLGGDGQAAAWIGFNPPRARYRKEAADALVRRAAVQRLADLYEGAYTEKNLAQVDEAMPDLVKAPLVDFQYSAPAIILQNLSGGAWLTGICIPLFALLGWS